ncbi:MAG: Chagasin family peptidase inhibitor [Solirubrobacteraceae bacterium]|nr:Chagasin family peptidase inhibitor [Solirubrobacteraceae bacterium]
MTRTIRLGALVLLTAAAGCGGGGGASQLRLDDPTGRGPVALKPGQQLVVSLAVNHGIGTDWVIGPRPAAAVLRYRGAAYHPHGRQLPGSGGSERFVFDARARGEAHAVFLHYFRGKLTGRRDLRIVVK